MITFQRWWWIALCLLVRMSALPATAAADASSPWSPGPGAVGDDTLSGAIDTPANGATVSPSSSVVVQGWVVDTTAVGWTGIDAVDVYLGLQDQGGPLIAHANVGQRRDDVAAALGNPYWATAGFSVSFAETSLATGSNMLTIYAHTPDRGWWYRQVQVGVPAPPDRPYADDPLLVVRSITPASGINELDILHSTQTLTLAGYAIDRNMPQSLSLGVGGSGVARIQVFLDGPRNGGGIPLGDVTLGLLNREATGFGQRFLNSGWQITLHPNDYWVDRHEFFMYALSAYWPNEALLVIPFNEI
jgi:hypothetical protein